MLGLGSDRVEADEGEVVLRVDDFLRELMIAICGCSEIDSADCCVMVAVECIVPPCACDSRLEERDQVILTRTIGTSKETVV